VTVFDMVNELFPAEFPGSEWLTGLKRESVRNADHVICISESTRKDLVRLFDIPLARTSVIHLAANDPPPMHREAARGTSNANRPFILFVGGRWGYKNFAGLLRAFAASATLRRDFGIVAVGGGPLAPHERTEIETLGLASLVAQVEADDVALDHLYRTAVALVYPSLYEGFGLPPLEAMSRGCAVIASRSSSIPEVVGSAAELFDADDAASMSRAIETVAYDDHRRQDLIARGAERVKLFTWRRCAEETLAVYRELIRRESAA
jgi:glycosyltransferase involved in cell wall biosynthesis